MHTPGTEIPVSEKVQFLSRPGSYPNVTRVIEVVETHMSWVFLADSLAYKLKKPVRYPFLDFSTLEARRRDSEEEVRLNRRLAADVYLGTVPLTLGQNRRLSLGGVGDAVEWLVKMRRLPAECMLDNAIKSHSVEMPQIRNVAGILSRFYEAASPITIKPSEYRHRLTRYVQENYTELAREEYRLDQALVCSVCEAQTRMLRKTPDLFDKRVQGGHVIECHGDLRPEHICLEPRPVIIDCLEFKREFRELDTADELAFLAIECEHLGAGHIGDEVFRSYSACSGDAPDDRLIAFYKSHRAALRAKISLWHTRDGNIKDHSKWTDTAREYLMLGQEYARSL